ncbi:hypothetical protein LUZ60_017375 [Juncus effusus]|nr:hypothetical protein LUZ60_017375 [Juncus effusus]
MKCLSKYITVVFSIIAILVLKEILSSPTSFQWLITSPTQEQKNGTRNEKFLQVQPIYFGGLNNQKIALAKALLTARFLNRTLLMPVFSQILSFTPVDSHDTIAFDKIFDFDRFNSLCDGFVQLGRCSSLSNKTKPFEMKKKGKRWTRERDMDQLRRYRNDRNIDAFEIINIRGKQAFFWEDYWSVNDYAKIFECLVLVSEIEKEVTKVTSKIKEVSLKTRNDSDSNSGFNSDYITVHMRVERDWMAHCEQWQKKSNITNICSSKEEIVKMVSHITPKSQPSVVYLAVADSLLDDDSILSGWGPGLIPYDKKSLGVWDIYKKYPYLIQSAIDFEVCARANIFLGNSFSTFSGLVVLSRTYKLLKLGIMSLCNGSYARYSTYAYNVVRGSNGGPKLWMTNMSDSSLVSITYGSVDVSCECRSVLNV